MKDVYNEVPGLYSIIPLKELRRTPGVLFDMVPMQALKRIDAIDRVLHEPGAVSPGPVGGVQRPWYMHPNQADNLIVLHGTRNVDLYRKGHGKLENFEVGAQYIKRNGQTLYDGPAMLVWPRGVFHRIVSSEREGSASLNFAVHYAGFDIKTNFSIYDLDTTSGDFKVIREGFKDQPGGGAQEVAAQ